MAARYSRHASSHPDCAGVDRTLQALAWLLLVVSLAVGASNGSPGMPGIGFVILAMMLGTVGIPAEGIALIIGVGRVLDMRRTTLNVAGDRVAASVIDRVTAAAQPAADAKRAAVS